MPPLSHGHALLDTSVEEAAALVSVVRVVPSVLAHATAPTIATAVSEQIALPSLCVTFLFS